jgi:hypothetical protein
MELVNVNKKYFQPFYGQEGWRSFLDGNLLNDYVNDNYIPIIKSKGYTWWRGGYTNRERFFKEANRYIDESTRIINSRACKMIEILRSRV